MNPVRTDLATAAPRGNCKGLNRGRFPALERTIRGHPLIYLDSSATAQKPLEVIEAEARFYRESNANVHRGVHTLAEEATAAYEGCREKTATFLGARAPQDVVVTRGATSAINLVARGIEHHLETGDEIVLTVMEHHANLLPWQGLARRKGLHLRVIPTLPDGRLDEEAWFAALGPRTKIAALTHVSNVLGTINPIDRLAAAAREAGARVLVDAAQSVGHLPVRFDDLEVDWLAFSAHKAYGPTGLGFLVGRPDALDLLEPMETGGEMIDEVWEDSATWAAIPHRFEAGTPNIAAAAGFSAALDFLEGVTPERLRYHERELARYALERLESLGGLALIGPRDPELRGGLVSFTDAAVHPLDLVTFLDQEGIALRAGHHCAQPLHRALGLAATVRASFGAYTNKDDIDALVEGIRRAREYFA